MSRDLLRLEMTVANPVLKSQMGGSEKKGPEVWQRQDKKESREKEKELRAEIPAGLFALFATKSGQFPHL